MLRAGGLTLVEFLFATSVVAVALLGVAGMFPAALRSVVKGGDTTKATILAGTMTEMIRTERFDDLISRYDGFDTRATIGGYTCPVTATTSPDYNKMRMKCEISFDGVQNTGRGLPEGYVTVGVGCVNPDGTVNTANPCPTELRRITVTVFYEPAGARSFQLTTYVARWE